MYLHLSAHSDHKLPSLPKPLQGVVTQEKFEKARAYSIDKSNFNFNHEAVNILINVAILYFRVLPWICEKSGNFVFSLGLNADNEIIHTLVFLGVVMIWSQITDLPFSLYSTFVIEERDGFNEQTIWAYI